MGIAKGSINLICELGKSVKFSGLICQLGRQTIHPTGNEISKIAASFGIDIKLPEKVDDKILFSALGFDGVESIDISDLESPTHVWDLNKPVPNNLINRYDFIIDGGTLEHIFDFRAALANIHKMLKPGGLVIHLSPSHNHVDHGFYMFSPTVYWDYYGANKYEIMKMYIFEYSPLHNKMPWTIFQYDSQIFQRLSYGGWGRKMLGIWCVAQKTENSTSDVIPQQGQYRMVWKGRDAGRQRQSRSKKLIKLLFANSVFQDPVRRMWERLNLYFIRFEKNKLKVIGKF